MGGALPGVVGLAGAAGAFSLSDGGFSFTDLVSEGVSVVKKEAPVVTEGDLLVTGEASVVTEDSLLVTEDVSVVKEDNLLVTEEASVVTEKASLVLEMAALVLEMAALVLENASAALEDAALVLDAMEGVAGGAGKLPSTDAGCLRLVEKMTAFCEANTLRRWAPGSPAPCGQ